MSDRRESESILFPGLLCIVCNLRYDSKEEWMAHLRPLCHQSLERIAALTAELERYKAFVREKCGVFENETFWYNDQCFACMEAKAFGNLQHKPDCLYIAAGGE